MSTKRDRTGCKQSQWLPLKRWLSIAMLLLALQGASLLAGIAPASAALLLDTQETTANQEEQLVKEAWRIVNRAYLDETFNHQNWWLVRQQLLKHPLRDREETYDAIQTMLTSLEEPFTRLLRPEQYRTLKVSTSGELTGIGLQIALDEETGFVQAIAPIEGSPAEKAGIRPRDRIVEIDGLTTTEMTLDESAAAMRGPAGSKVTLLLERAASRERETVNLVRDRISLNPVVASLKTVSTPTGNESIGYIRLSQFNGNATTEVARAIKQFKRQGADAYILDLRSNPGGLLQAGIEIARLWLDRGTIVYTVNRQGNLGSFDANGQALTDDPLVVLVNQGTASASEILAGALQDNGRAQVVGETTFGKGLIQSLFDLSDGAGVAVTVAKYETPDHRDIHKLGITPDRVVELDAIARDEIATPADPQYQAAVDLLASSRAVAGAS